MHCAAKVAKLVDAPGLGPDAFTGVGVRVPPFAPSTNFQRLKMQQTIQSLSALERRVDLTVPAAAIEQEVKTRLAKLARGMKMPGFRPGKVPIKMVAQTYGAQVQAEVLNDKVGEAFNSAVTASKLKVAGQPRLEARTAPTARSRPPTATRT